MRARFKVFIPARYAASRLPGKPLLDVAGKPLIQHVYENAAASGAEAVVIATDDERIRVAAERFGAEVQMTPSSCRSGTERIGVLIQRCAEPDDAIIVNVQADEPLLAARLIGEVAQALAERPKVQIATLCAPIDSVQSLFDPGVVKVVCNGEGLALYFSRAAIPWHRDAFANERRVLPDGVEYRQHIGVYAYRAGYLLQYLSLPPCDAEQVECLEQLRALHHGARIHVHAVDQHPGSGVDTPADLERVRALLVSRSPSSSKPTATSGPDTRGPAV